ncbi:hypothetical protein DSM100688_1466 [Bifidobacterium ramosum]|uniref:Uncharacterized protein n=1 Tax=Bifidobacterium ramosum TaxID=1798158 RepID=A0A6L4WZQ5_9BIFI|nr:hypothetical protein [Bifidobacterium ramosum]KAB8287678.1 hypothetical protein DSM100688_1466 [Bifidobacterium ramosum]NEG72292.1 hypothetical protein [Bifidobacterium ramosum]
MAAYLVYSWQDGLGVLRDAYGHKVESRSGSPYTAESACRQLFQQRYPQFWSDEVRFVDRKH